MTNLCRSSLKKEIGYEDLRNICVQRGYGGRCYRSSWKLPLGITVYTDPADDSYGHHLNIEIKGECLSVCGMDAVRKLFGLFDGLLERWSASRIDLTWDWVPFTPAMLRDAWREDNVRTLVKRDTPERIEAEKIVGLARKRAWSHVRAGRSLV